MAAEHQDTHEGGYDSATAVAEHQQTFEGFIRFWVYVFLFAALVLIFLAIFNT